MAMEIACFIFDLWSYIQVRLTLRPPDKSVIRLTNRLYPIPPMFPRRALSSRALAGNAKVGPLPYSEKEKPCFLWLSYLNMPLFAMG
jgi:hypothetical protein